MLSTTPSECARYARAELEAIIACLQLSELAELLRFGRNSANETSRPIDHRRLSSSPGNRRLWPPTSRASDRRPARMPGTRACARAGGGRRHDDRVGPQTSAPEGVRYKRRSWRTHARRHEQPRPARPEPYQSQERHEVDYWAKRFGVSKERLEAAVKAVGQSADAVERHLRG